MWNVDIYKIKVYDQNPSEPRLTFKNRRLLCLILALLAMHNYEK
jgi:hypothetical protein